MRFAKIKNSIVENIIVADQSFCDDFAAANPEYSFNAVTDETMCDIGWTWNGSYYEPPQE